MKKFLNEFKEFAIKGNMFDLAVGVIIGAAFQAIINSLVNDLISPLIGTIIQTDFNDLYFTINNVDVYYGKFITAFINFLIMAFVIFLLVKAVSKIREKVTKKEIEEPTVKKCPYCCGEVPIEAKKCMHCTSDLEK